MTDLLAQAKELVELGARDDNDGTISYIGKAADYGKDIAQALIDAVEVLRDIDELAYGTAQQLARDFLRRIGGGGV